jgi:hypothetical protein
MSSNRIRSIQTATILRIGAVFFMAASPLLISACDNSAKNASTAGVSDAPADTYVEYTVRGRVTQLPGGPEHPAREFIVRHEAIPEFRNTMTPGDDRMGMMSMAMAFPLGEGVSIEGISVGDPVEMMFKTAYDGETGRLKGYTVERLTPLDPGTALEIAESKPRLP